MFLNRLTELQQGALLSLAAQLMAADGKRLAAEAALLESLRRQVASGVTPAQAATADLPALFPDRPARVALLLELLGMALVDADFHAAEQAFVTGIADVLGVDRSELSDMESWVHRQFAMVREAERLMEA